GGEEIVLVLPRALPAEATDIIQRMLSVVRNSRPLSDLPSFSYTFSAGMAVARKGDSLTDVYRRGDLALYGAKLSGRDRLQIDIDMPSAEGNRL
ncbi:MAG: diguanylate cyclase, partial [Rhizobiaceae bacterium]|nr:diguanylate cyclase [Rhizobiaceae bacterium]